MTVSTAKKKIPGAILIMQYDQTTRKVLKVQVQPMIWNPADKDILGGPIQNPIYDLQEEQMNFDLLTRLGQSASIEETFYLLKRLEILI